MRGRDFRMSALAVGCLLPGCAIAPSQQEVTGIDTPNIVANIRCEARDAIRGQIAGYLQDMDGNQTAQMLADELADRSRPLSQIDLRGLDWETKRLLASYRDFVIVYDFTLDGKISNDLNGAPTATETFSTGNRTFPLTAKLNRSRQNIQNFRQTDTFGGLLRDTDSDYCPDPHRNRPRNYVYPIVGTIGIARQLNDFVSLFGLANLASKADDKDGPPTFSSDITFTTTIEGTVNPTVTITPVLGETVWGGNYGLTSSRTDQHEVVIAFAASDRTLSDAEVDAFLAAPGAKGPRSNTARSSRATQAANEAANQAILRFDIGRRTGVVVVNRPFISLF